MKTMNKRPYTNRLRNLAFDLRAIGTILRLAYLQWYDKQEACWRVYYMHNRIAIDAIGSAACIFVLALGVITSGIGWTLGSAVVKACGSVAALLGFVGVVICESGRG